jgi:hypothetical protein
MTARWGLCARRAAALFGLLRRTGSRKDAVWLGLGNLSVGRISRDHAWIALKAGDYWWTVDPSLAALASLRSGLALAYRPLAYLREDSILTRGGLGLPASFCPGFFLDVHLYVEAVALNGIFPREQIAAMNAMNSKADLSGYDPREHCDNATISEGLLLAADRLAWANGTTPLGTVLEAPREVAYGLAFHTVADLYAHSSYVPSAAYYFGGLQNVPPFDVGYRDSGFRQFLASPIWSSAHLWHAPKPYSAHPFPLEGPLEHSLITGAYPQGADQAKDGWLGRQDIPIHDHFAVDQPDSALVHANEIEPRSHPFAFPYVWLPHFESRERLAIQHLRSIATRLAANSPDPLLSYPLLPPPDLLFPPEWILTDGRRIGEVPFLVRDSTGEPVRS